MNKSFETLEPQSLWQHFKEIMAIPHPSLHEQGIREYVKSFAATHNVEYQEDKAGNVILRKSATKGMESAKGIILQGHMDMVPQKSNDNTFDFESDPIDGYIDGEWVRANGTTLGADNGIGLAAALAVFEDDELLHGDLEALFTVNEERGMDGAFGLEEGLLKGDILLNLDTEVEGELCIGCAGGLNLTVTLEHEMVESPQGEYVARRLKVGGVRGGHSGIQINEQRGNANKLLFRLLRLTKLELLISAVEGGTLHNAIPREAYADILVHVNDIKLFEEQVANYQATLNTEFKPIENGNITVSLSEIEYPETIIDESAASCLVWAVAGAPDGVDKMSYTIPDLVQNSSNLGVLKSDDTKTTIEFLIRSSSESEKTALADTIASVFELADGEVACTGGYPGWLPNVDSEILKIMRESHNELFGREPEVIAVHAGLECGIIGATYPNLDMISFGPTILSPHSPAECVKIDTVANFYKLLRHTIINAPKR